MPHITLLVSMQQLAGGNSGMVAEGITFVDFRSNVKASNLLLPSSEEDTYADGKLNVSPASHQFKGSGQWETLEVYLVCMKTSMLSSARSL